MGPSNMLGGEGICLGQAFIAFFREEKGMVHPNKTDHAIQDDCNFHEFVHVFGRVETNPLKNNRIVQCYSPKDH